MSQRATLQEVADRAGVSRATVDRVINGRQPVRRATAERVFAAARELGYHALHLLGERVEALQRPLRLGILFQSRQRSFYRELAMAIEQAATAKGPICGQLLIEELEQIDPAHTAARCRRLAEKVDGLAIVAFDHPMVKDAVEEAASNGTPVISLLSGLSDPTQSLYVGLDNVKAGRTAAWFMARLIGRAGRVGIVCGSYNYRSQQDRELGFRNYLLDNEPQISLATPRYYLEDNAVAAESVADLLATEPQLAGLYGIGVGVRGMTDALRRHSASRPRFICHELTATARNGLAQGLIDIVIDTPRRALAEAMLDALIAKALDPRTSPFIPRIDFAVVCPESL